MKRTDLHEYQNFCVEFLKTHPEAMLILEMGLGKSAVSLTAILDLMFDSFDVGKVLVIAPLRVAKTVWPEERDTWEHAHFLKMSVMVGSAKQREAALQTPADIYVVNRENLKWLTDYLEKEADSLRVHHKDVMAQLRQQSETIAGLIREKNIDRKALSTAAGQIGCITWRELNV